jgi:hypothetical protein
LDFYNLANSLDSLKELIDIKLIEKSWAKLLFQFRFHDDLFSAALCNAQIILKSTFTPNVNAMMKGRPFMALGTLMFSSTSFARTALV